MGQETRNCQNCSQSFLIEDEDFAFYKKIDVPPPTWCPECRLIRRLAWRNVRTLYKRKCDLCQKDFIGVYAPDKPYTVYCSKCWWSDGWDAMQYGRDYGFSRPFFQQYGELMRAVPLVGRFVYEDTMVNSDYTNMADDLKDCYLVFVCGGCERCMYSDNSNFLNDSLDTSYAYKSELLYDSLNLRECYRVFYSRDSVSCRDSYFLDNCVGCSDCFGCANLRNKQYHIFNKPYSKDDYVQELERIGFRPGSLMSVTTLRDRAHQVWERVPKKYMHGTHNMNATGDYVNNARDTFHSFYINNAENIKFCAYLMYFNSVKDSYDWTQYGNNGELVYEMLQSGEGVYNNHFGWCNWRHAKNCEYGILNVNSSDCFGCIGVKNKRFCIFNKQYSEIEYRSLRTRIIKHMDAMPFTDEKGRVYRYGEFFPIASSPFYYNETNAHEEFPLIEEDAKSRGYRWGNPDAFRGAYTTTKQASELPDDIAHVQDTITSDIIECGECSSPYRIIAQELAFYRAQKIPLPRACHNCRYRKRLQQKTYMKLRQQKCHCAGAKSENSVYANTGQHFHGSEHCPNEFETSYAPARKEILYCEQCYNAEIA